jgi:hypothetical protein
MRAMLSRIFLRRSASCLVTGDSFVWAVLPATLAEQAF